MIYCIFEIQNINQKAFFMVHQAFRNHFVLTICYFPVCSFWPSPSWWCTFYLVFPDLYALCIRYFLLSYLAYISMCTIQCGAKLWQSMFDFFARCIFNIKKWGQIRKPANQWIHNTQSQYNWTVTVIKSLIYNLWFIIVTWTINRSKTYWIK